MRKTLKGALAFFVILISFVCVFALSGFAASEDAKWITAWGTAPTEIGIDGYDNISAYVGKVTVRSVLSPSASGSKLRIRITNAYGKEDMKLTRVTLAKSKGGTKIDLSTLKMVTFNKGQPFVSVPAGKEYVSDPVDMKVEAGEKIAISIFVEDFTEVKTMGLSGADTYIATSLEGDGDFTDQESMDLGSILDDEELMQYLSMISGGDVDIKLAASFIKVVPCLASVEVLADENAYSVVIAGDSTVANEFPEYLGNVINEKGYNNVGIVGKGVVGNRLLGDGLGYGSLIFGDSLIDRFQRDVLSQAGLKYVVIKIGANDIIHPVCKDIKEQYPDIKQPTSAEIIAGYKKLFKMCHDAGVKVIAMSITPWKGATRDYLNSEPKYVRTTAQFEKDWKIAQEVNSWLSKTSLHDGYVNANKYSVNPKDPAAFMPEYTIDGIHPSDSMQKVWAKKFPLSLIGVGKTVAGLSLNKTSAELFVGDKLALKANIYPSGAKNKKVKWSSSNSKVLKVSSKGVVTCVGKGTATITCKTDEGGYKAKCKITVREKATSVKLNKTKVTIYTTKSVQLKATVLPEGAHTKGVTWSSSNTDVATVDKKGKVTAVGSGKAVITVKTETGKKTAKCTVTVKKKVQVSSVELSRSRGTLYKGQSYQLRATVFPSKATFPELKWTTGNKKVATVSSKGKIKAVGKGTTVITCRSVDNPRAFTTFRITVKSKATGVELNHSKASMYEGTKGILRASVKPADASNKNVKWSSSNTKVLKVDKNGKLTAIKPGKAVITCTTVKGGYSDKCTITVKKVVPVKSVKLNKERGSMYIGDSYLLKATVSPENASIKDVKWSSSDSKVVKVNSNGKITGLRAGMATITCKSEQGGKIAQCKVKVVPVKVKSIKLNIKSKTIANGKTYQIKATMSPANATNKSLKWSSSNPQAVSVSDNGLVKALKPNSSAVITCKNTDGKVSASCTIKVARIKVTGVKLNRNTASIDAGKTLSLFAAVSPSNASVKSVIWTTSDAEVATVDKSGVVTGKGGGTATIYCETKDGGYVAACQVTVTGKNVLGVMLDQGTVNKKVGDKFALKATVIPTDAINKNVTWTSNDEAIATVDAQGNVTCIASGSCYITVTTKDGNWIDTCKVTVS